MRTQSARAACWPTRANLHEQRREDCITVSQGRLRAPEVPLDCGRSFTALKLMLGLLATQDFERADRVTGTAAAPRHASRGTAAPARRGDRLRGIGDSAPLRIRGQRLQVSKLEIAVRDAEVRHPAVGQSLHGGPLRIVEKAPSRDHSERLMKHMGIVFGH
ncbi:MAG: hypothetical protein R3F46_14010 [bacterium]